MIETGQLRAEISHQKGVIRDLELSVEVQKDGKEELLAQIGQLQGVVGQLEHQNDALLAENTTFKATILDLQDSLERANQTIRVQSNQILNPRDGRRYTNPAYQSDSQGTFLNCLLMLY